MKKVLFLLLVSLLITGSITAQDKKKFSDNFAVQGYIKLIPSVTFQDGDSLVTNNLIHNRINLKGYFGSDWTLKVELRNRIYYGEEVKLNPMFGEQLDQDDGLVNLSLLWGNKKAVVGHSILDRAQLNYAKGKWDITLGRQRVNWGVTLLWNSNDLFNAYNFVDFDYTERPGSDALRVQYYLTDFTSIETVYKPGKDLDHSIIASLYKMNKWNYDLQFLLANFNEDIAIGTGWAGNLKQLGFKGEATYFRPKDDMKSKEAFSATIGLDYAFKAGLYLNYGVLLNTLGENKLTLAGLQFLSGSSLSSKNLMPTKFSHFLQSSYTFNPIISSSLSIIYGQGADIIFIMPNVTYSIKDNWDLDLTAQLFYAPDPVTGDITNLVNSVFLRLQYSY